MEELEAGGFIRRFPAPANQRRPVEITARGWQALGESSVMGRVAAGRGLEAVSDEEAYSLAGELLVSRVGKQRYLLRIFGRSMAGAGIHDGDIVIVEEEVDPPDGAVVVALLEDDEVTVKRLYRQNGHIRLKAESHDHEDIVIAWGAAEIQGMVLTSIHNIV